MDILDGIHTWYWLSDEYYGHWFDLTITELYTTPPVSGQDHGTSVIRWTLSHEYTLNVPYEQHDAVRVAPTRLTIEDNTVYEKTTVSLAGPDAVFPAKVGSRSGQLTIPHDADGSKTVHIEFWSNFSITTPTLIFYVSFPLTHIDQSPVSYSLFDLRSEIEDYHQFRFVANEIVDELHNLSIINWKVQHVLTGASQYPNTTVSPITVKIDDTVLYETSSALTPTHSGFPTSAGEVSGSLTVPHNTDGRRTIKPMLWMAWRQSRTESDKVTQNVALANIQTETHYVDFLLETEINLGHQILLKVTERPDYASNTSIMSWSLYSKFENSNYQQANYSQIYVELGTDPNAMTKVYNFYQDPDFPPSGSFPNTAGTKSGTYVAVHNLNGEADIYAKLYVLPAGASYPTILTYNDTLSNTNRNPPETTIELERASYNEASFIITSNVSISATQYCKVEAKPFKTDGSVNKFAVGDYCVYSGALYQCLTAINDSSAWDATKWQETDMLSVSSWSHEGFSYTVNGNELRAVVSKGLSGNTNYAIIFDVANAATGISGPTDIVTFITASDTILYEAEDVKFDASSVKLRYKWSAYKPELTYKVDIYAKIETEEETTEVLLGSINNITQTTTVERQIKQLTLSSTIVNEALEYLANNTEAGYFMVLHTYESNVEVIAAQRADFIGYLEEEDSKPTYTGTCNFLTYEETNIVNAFFNNVPIFSTSDSYSIGDYVYYDDDIWKAIANVSAGDWNSSQWEKQDVYSYATDVFIKGVSKCKFYLDNVANPSHSVVANPVTITYEATLGTSKQDGIVENGGVYSYFKSFSKTGDLPSKFDAVDSRGFRNSKSKNVQILDYTKPKITQLSAYRNNNRLGTLLYIDVEGTQSPVRYSKVELTDAESIEYIYAISSIPIATVTEIKTAYNTYGLTDEVKQMIIDACNTYIPIMPDLMVTRVTELITGYVSVSTAKAVLIAVYNNAILIWNNIYDIARFNGVDDPAVASAITLAVSGDADKIAAVTKIITGTYNMNYICKAELRYAKSNESYTNTWIDVTSYITTQTDEAFIIECYEDPNIVLDADYSYKLQLRVYDLLTVEGKGVSSEIGYIPAGAPLMSFQKRRVGINNRDPKGALDVYGFDYDDNGTTVHVDGYAIDGQPILGHVIEDVTTASGWHYRKWSNGYLECSLVGLISTRITTYEGELYKSADVGSKSYPVKFVSEPTVTVSIKPPQACNSAVFITRAYSTSASSKTATGPFVLLSTRTSASWDGGNNANFNLYVHATGFWK